MFKHVFVTTDGSALGDAALPLAARLASTCGASLTVAYAVPEPVGVYTGPYLIDPVVAQDELRAAGRGVLSSAARTLGPGTRTCLIDARGQDIADALLRAAHDEHADVIVMSTHGRSGLQHLLLGSVAERVLRRADLPVLLQRTGPAQTKSVASDQTATPAPRP